METKATLVPRAMAVQVGSAQLIIQLADEREIRVPLAWFPRLQAGTPEQRASWHLIGGGAGIHWEELDEDVSVAGLLGLPD